WLTKLSVALRIFKLIALAILTSATAVVVGRIACFGDIERLRRRLFRRQVVIVVETCSHTRRHRLFPFIIKGLFQPSTSSPYPLGDSYAQLSTGSCAICRSAPHRARCSLGIDYKS